MIPYCAAAASRQVSDKSAYLPLTPSVCQTFWNRHLGITRTQLELGELVASPMEIMQSEVRDHHLRGTVQGESAMETKNEPMVRKEGHQESMVS